MEPIYYMEYRETKKAIEEMFDAYYKYSNAKRWKIFRDPMIDEKIQEKTQKRYAEIHEKERRDRTITAKFYEEHFLCTTGDVVQEYVYDEIEGLYETDTTLVFIAGKKRKKESFLALKKGSLKGKSLHDLKAFLLDHCVKAGGEVHAL